MRNITNINYTLNTAREGGIKFTFCDENGKWGEAYLQLPDTGDSIHVINGISSDDEWSDNEKDIYSQLFKYYRAQFNDVDCYAASSFLGIMIVDVEEIYYKHRQIFVAFDEGYEPHLLVESRYKDYYNKAALFDDFDPYSIFGDEEYSAEDIIEKARRKGGIKLND